MPEVTQERILLVDDEQAVLDGLCRQHRKQFDLAAACGPEEGLRRLETDGPFAVVVSDYQMPAMNGAEFLERTRDKAPDVVRIMLTGQADLRTAIDAVNRGHIFRFLTKPCEPELFRVVLEAGLEQHRLRHAERLLLEHTVKGCIEVLSDVLALSNPMAFGRAQRARHYVRHIVSELNLDDSWQYETAALLSQIGCVAVPDDVFKRMAAGETLPSEQMAMMDQHPALARDLLRKIPRFERVAEMIAWQRQPIAREARSSDPVVEIGGRILAASLAFEELVSLGATPAQALQALQKDRETYDGRVVAALAGADVQTRDVAVRLAGPQDLRVGMILEEEIRAKDTNILIVATGHELTAGSLQRLRNYADLKLIRKHEWRVRISKPGIGDEAAVMA